MSGEPAAVVVLPQAPSWIELEAAQELVDHVAKMSGAHLPIQNESSLAGWLLPRFANQTAIFIGNVSSLPRSLQLPPEGFRVWVDTIGDAPALFVRGDDSCNASWPGASHSANIECRRGTLFGIYTLLERLGVVWLWPGPTGEAVPRRQSVSVPADLDVADAPKLLTRRYRATYGNSAMVGAVGRWSSLFRPPFNFNVSRVVELAAQERQWLNRMRVGSHDTPPWGSTFSGWWYVQPASCMSQPDLLLSRATRALAILTVKWLAGRETYGKEHPEWFALLQPNTTDNPSATARRGPWMHDGHMETAGVKMCANTPLALGKPC